MLPCWHTYLSSKTFYTSKTKHIQSPLLPPDPDIMRAVVMVTCLFTLRITCGLRVKWMTYTTCKESNQPAKTGHGNTLGSLLMPGQTPSNMQYLYNFFQFSWIFFIKMFLVIKKGNDDSNEVRCHNDWRVLTRGCSTCGSSIGNAWNR